MMAADGRTRSLSGPGQVPSVGPEAVPVPVEQFNPEDLQDANVLLPNGGRRNGRSYVNNFFFFPQHLDGESMLNG